MVIQVVRIYVLSVLSFVAVRPQMRHIYRVLHTIAIEYTQDEFQDKPQEFKVVQHLSPACRAARRHGTEHLASATILHHVDDAHAEQCQRASNYAVPLAVALLVFFPVVVGALHEMIGDLVFEALLPLALNSFALANVYLYAVSVFALVLPYVVLLCVFIWAKHLFPPAHHRVKKMRSERQLTNGSQSIAIGTRFATPTTADPAASSSSSNAEVGHSSTGGWSESKRVASNRSLLNPKRTWSALVDLGALLIHYLSSPRLLKRWIMQYISPVQCNREQQLWRGMNIPSRLQAQEVSLSRPSATTADRDGRGLAIDAADRWSNLRHSLLSHSHSRSRSGVMEAIPEQDQEAENQDADGDNYRLGFSANQSSGRDIEMTNPAHSQSRRKGSVRWAGDDHISDVDSIETTGNDFATGTRYGGVDAMSGKLQQDQEHLLQAILHMRTARDWHEAWEPMTDTSNSVSNSNNYTDFTARARSLPLMARLVSNTLLEETPRLQRQQTARMNRNASIGQVLLNGDNNGGALAKGMAETTAGAAAGEAAAVVGMGPLSAAAIYQQKYRQLAESDRLLLQMLTAFRLRVHRNNVAYISPLDEAELLKLPSSELLRFQGQMHVSNAHEQLEAALEHWHPFDCPLVPHEKQQLLQRFHRWAATAAEPFDIPPPAGAAAAAAAAAAEGRRKASRGGHPTFLTTGWTAARNRAVSLRAWRGNIGRENGTGIAAASGEEGTLLVVDGTQSIPDAQATSAQSAQPTLPTQISLGILGKLMHSHIRRRKSQQESPPCDTERATVEDIDAAKARAAHAREEAVVVAGSSDIADVSYSAVYAAHDSFSCRTMQGPAGTVTAADPASGAIAAPNISPASCQKSLVREVPQQQQQQQQQQQLCALRFQAFASWFRGAAEEVLLLDASPLSQSLQRGNTLRNGSAGQLLCHRAAQSTAVASADVLDGFYYRGGGGGGGGGVLARSDLELNSAGYLSSASSNSEAGDCEDCDEDGDADEIDHGGLSEKIDAFFRTFRFTRRQALHLLQHHDTVFWGRAPGVDAWDAWYVWNHRSDEEHGEDLSSSQKFLNRPESGTSGVFGSTDSHPLLPQALRSLGSLQQMRMRSAAVGRGSGKEVESLTADMPPPTRTNNAFPALVHGEGSETAAAGAASGTAAAVGTAICDGGCAAAGTSATTTATIATVVAAATLPAGEAEVERSSISTPRREEVIGLAQQAEAEVERSSISTPRREEVIGLAQQAEAEVERSSISTPRREEVIGARPAG